MRSLLSWERGLKYTLPDDVRNIKPVAPLVGAWIEIDLCIRKGPGINVAPLVGAWIEIFKILIMLFLVSVAPLVGAWIEIPVYIDFNAIAASLLSWERGLK